MAATPIAYQRRIRNQRSTMIPPFHDISYRKFPIRLANSPQVLDIILGQLSRVSALYSRPLGSSGSGIFASKCGGSGSSEIDPERFSLI